MAITPSSCSPVRARHIAVQICAAYGKCGLPAEFVDRYAGWGATELWQQVNVSPHFPYAAQIWTAMWRARTGEQLDGVIAIDPFTLGYLLDATGPVRLDDGTALTGANAADFILKDEYAVLAGAQRKQYLVTLGRAVFDL